MSKLKKCLYLINLLERKGPLTLRQINESFQYSSLYDGEILPRTFARYKDYIDETFPCYIEFNTRTNKYELHRHRGLYGEDDSLYDYLLSAYHIEGMTELALKHRDKIMLSAAPTGVENVQLVLEAIDKKRNRMRLLFVQYANDKTPTNYPILPPYLGTALVSCCRTRQSTPWNINICIGKNGKYPFN